MIRNLPEILILKFIFYMYAFTLFDENSTIMFFLSLEKII